MKYVFVGSWKQPKNGMLNYTIPAVNQSENLLISLIDILQKDITMGADQNFEKEIILTKNQIQNNKLYLDSGGYSIIVGDVPGKDVEKFIDQYHICQNKFTSIYDYIFSLDIPVFLNEPIFNTKTEIKRFNYLSMAKSKINMINNSIIRDKFLFVWQFKIQDQYDIWNDLYDELKMSEVVKYRAIGGMVGLRGITQINFSPFIGPLFRCLLDYIDNGDFSYPFKVHNLGVYIQHDRFFLCFLERIFQRWLSKLYNTDKVELTYDSVNYMRTAQLRARDLQIYSFRSGTHIEIFKHTQVPDSILQQVYTDNNSYIGVKTDIDNCLNDRKLQNIDAFTPLNVYSNVQLDKFFMYLVDKYNLTDKCQNPGGWVPELEKIQAAHPNVFSSQRIKCLEQNFEWFHEFKQWFLEYNTKPKYTRVDKYNSLNKVMTKFIKAINFPAHFEDVYKFKPQNSSDFFNGD